MLYSRMFTQAIRLMGINAYVEFEYDELDLRPKAEQEAYLQMRQSRMLMLCSLGFMTTAETSINLTGYLPPQGMPDISGTNFMSGAAKVQDTTSQTSLMNGQKDSLKSDAPTGAKSS